MSQSQVCITWYGLLDHLQPTPEVLVSKTRFGQTQVKAGDLCFDIRKKRANVINRLIIRMDGFVPFRNFP